MGNGTSRVVGCFVPFNGKKGVELDFLEPLDEGIGHSFCYVRPPVFESPAITPSNSERFTLDSSTLDSETLSGSFRHDTMEDSLGLQRQSKSFRETTFRTISGASVSANVSTARTGNQIAMFATDVQEPAASFESTSLFAAIPLQPVPRGSGPLNGFLSGPLERGFASGPLDKGGGFMSGPIEKGVMSGPLDAADKSNFSAPLACGRRRPHFQRFMRSVSGPMKRTFSKHSMGSGWMQRIVLYPLTRLVWHTKEPKLRSESSRNCLEVGPSEEEYSSSRNLQWAHGKAGEDRVHVVLSEEQGWLFVGIYDGFSGPDAPDFLMHHLYKAIDKELEGLLWDYEDKSRFDPLKPETSKSSNPDADLDCSSKEEKSNSCLDQEILYTVGELLPQENIQVQSSNNEIVEENDDVRDMEQDLSKHRKSTLGAEFESVPHSNLAGQGRKSMRLFELLQMEPWDGQGSLSISQIDGQARGLCDCQPLYDNLGCINSSNSKDDRSNVQGEYPTTSGEDIGNFDNPSAVTAASMSGKRQNTRNSLFGSKVRKLYRKQKSLLRKLFPWSYDWDREDICVDERIVESSGPIRRCKSGVVDHDAVLRAMARALESTEDAYMQMVEKALEINPELALMGSCVLVMLIKDQDVYVMNLGDSRVILAEERPNDCHPNPKFAKDDLKYRNRSRELLGRMELDRISEESPKQNQHGPVSLLNKNRDLSICRLKMKAVQLSTDHSTSIEEEILRIKAEHPDDDGSFSNDRVKGQLKVTRAFGAAFLKKPACNEALLEMFRVDYVGNTPYLSCIPSVVHHRLSSSDRFLVLSSDGLYQYFSNEEVVAHVTWFMENVPEGDPAQYLVSELLFRAAKKNGMDFHELLEIPHGDRRKYHDDVSVMVVSLEGRIWRSSG
ncbi:Protein phosphatase 2C 32 [Hibiscus syriacus]|uniref:Protein phosphatase 2C 32 n=1 Tax=Hibiscus syriacus TaxID=106335 RepID=A0A6A3C5H2_HIBSY|nr:protein phosphatase 2C 32-like isoform X1 [Hibiscus syriacus]XP_039061839.1 protein phosphatase 2C 32-like isoform X1 [Hibiscus syriacus]KAE8722828.1 Protein phosphatase 2C 32 [Hibiscus syriacus]